MTTINPQKNYPPSATENHPTKIRKSTYTATSPEDENSQQKKTAKRRMSPNFPETISIDTNCFILHPLPNYIIIDHKYRRWW